MGSIPSIAAATPDSSVVASQLESLEMARVAALVAGKGGEAATYLADDYQLVTPSGATYSKGDYIAAIASGSLRYSAWTPISPIVVRAHGDVAVLRYQATITVQGVSGPETGIFWHTDYYERNAGVWLVVWSQATQVQ